MMNLNNWMAMQWLPMDWMAEKYTVGQDLTREQAAEVVRIIACSVDFDLNKPMARSDAFKIGNPYRDFVVCIVLLMRAGGHNPKWSNTIWDAMNPRLRTVCSDVIRQMVQK